MSETNLPYPVEELDGASIQVKDRTPVPPGQAVPFQSGSIEIRNGAGWIIIRKHQSPTLEIPFSRVERVVRREGPERSFYCLADFEELNLHTH
jgi:hypothetical protein